MRKVPKYAKHMHQFLWLLLLGSRNLYFLSNRGDHQGLHRMPSIIPTMLKTKEYKWMGKEIQLYRYRILYFLNIIRLLFKHIVFCLTWNTTYLAQFLKIVQCFVFFFPKMLTCCSLKQPGFNMLLSGIIR